MSNVLSWRVVADQSFISRQIRYVSRGRVSHMEFLSPDGQTAIGARSDGGVARRPVNYGAFSLDIRYSAPCSDAQFLAATEFLNAQLGKPYDYSAIFSILLARNWRDPDKWFCSELWASTMEQAGLIGKIEDAVNKFTPQDGLIVSSAMFGQGIYAAGNAMMLKAPVTHG